MTHSDDEGAASSHARNPDPDATVLTTAQDDGIKPVALPDSLKTNAWNNLAPLQSLDKTEFGSFLELIKSLNHTYTQLQYKPFKERGDARIDVFWAFTKQSNKSTVQTLRILTSITKLIGTLLKKIESGKDEYVILRDQAQHQLRQAQIDINAFKSALMNQLKMIATVHQLFHKQEKVTITNRGEIKWNQPLPSRQKDIPTRRVEQRVRSSVPHSASVPAHMGHMAEVSIPSALTQRLAPITLPNTLKSREWMRVRLPSGQKNTGISNILRHLELGFKDIKYLHQKELDNDSATMFSNIVDEINRHFCATIIRLGLVDAILSSIITRLPVDNRNTFRSAVIAMKGDINNFKHRISDKITAIRQIHKMYHPSDNIIIDHNWEKFNWTQG